MIADATAFDASTRGAVRFFWVWLMVAAGVSVAGNVAHAVLTAPAATVGLAGAAAVVPPAVLLGSTHSVALLVRVRRVGFNYWCALGMTLALAGCAFVLSFDALRDLAVALGMSPSRAWLWPVAIDVSIANSTLALLSLAPPRATPGQLKRPTVARPAPARQRQPAPTHASVDERSGPPATLEPVAETAAQRALAAVPDVTVAPVDPAALTRWKSTADQLVRSGVTSKDPDVVAAVLAEHAAGTAPSTIGRRLDIHYSTVGRIVAGAAELTG